VLCAHITQSIHRLPYLNSTVQDRAASDSDNHQMRDSKKELTRGLEARDMRDDMMTYTEH